MRTYGLLPTNGQKSFYNKAIVQIADDGTETLLSYGTLIARKTKDGKITRLWDEWSATTGRHIKAFCGLNKTEFLKLECK